MAWVRARTTGPSNPYQPYNTGRVRGVVDIVLNVDNRGAGVGDQVQGIGDQVQGIGSQVQGIGDQVQGVGD